MLARIDVCRGGKVAEEVIFGSARSDLQNATRLARHMVTECGMSDELGKPYMPARLPAIRACVCHMRQSMRVGQPPTLGLLLYGSFLC